MFDQLLKVVEDRTDPHDKHRHTYVLGAPDLQVSLARLPRRESADWLAGA